MSHEYIRKGLYINRERDRELDLPVPNYSGDREMPKKTTLNNLDKRRNQTSRSDHKDHREIYDITELQALSANSQHTEAGYSGTSSTTNIQQEHLNQSHASNYQASVYNGLPATALASQQPSDTASKHQEPQTTSPVLFQHNHNDHLKKEVVGQKPAPMKQVEDYKKKAALLKQELDTLRDQRNELRGDGKRSPSPDTKKFLKENTKLQLEIQNKLKTINNVLDMLNGIVGDQTIENEPEEILERKPKSRSPSNQKFNYVFYDPEMHWCRVCNEFPPTAKDYLNHLHSSVHQQMAAEHVEAPWHSLTGVNEGYPSFLSAPTKRTPIKGLQFFVPATAWYCKLCDQFIGDLHCASAHIKSIVHSRNYSDFVEHNPHWETDWMSDRQRAFEKARVEIKTVPAPVEDNTACSVKYTSHTITISKDFQRRQKNSNSEIGDEKKHRKKPKGRSSSQSSNSSESENNKQHSAKNKKLKCIEMGENKEVWNSPTPERLSDDDRKLLETLKSRMKRNRDEKQRSTSRERERIREMQKRIRESERRGRSSEQRDDSRERSRDRRYSRDRRDDRRNDCRPDSRERRPDSRERRLDSRERRPESRERRRGSRERRPDSRERRPDSRERRHDSRERRADSRDSRDCSRDRQSVSDKDQRTDSQVIESMEQTSDTQPVVTGLPLPLPLPLPTPLPTPASLPPPVIMPPPQPLLPPVQTIPSVPKDFQEALEILFPTDPQKCTEMLNAMQQQQPSLLGPAPGLGLYPPLGFMPPGMFGFDPSAMYQPPLLPMMGTRQAPRQNMHNRRRLERTGNKSNANRPAADSGKSEQDELMMLGMDASDVGAGM